MKKTHIIICLTGALAPLVISGCQAKDGEQALMATPAWLETDSTEAIQHRIVSDFNLTREQLLEAIQIKYPEVTDSDIDRFVAKHYLEAMDIDGEQRFFRKSVRNFGLLNPDYNGGVKPRGASASEARIAYVDSVLANYHGRKNKGRAHEVIYRFSIRVPGNEYIQGDTLRVWMPVPLDSIACARQSNFSVIDAIPDQYVLSDGRSVHNSIYFTAPAPAPGDTVCFEYTGKFITSGAYFAPSDIESNIKPYDIDSDNYKHYTAFDNRHIIRLDSLAHEIVGNETNPFRQSELVYDYIINRFPWAGAREYSTLDCIPRYVVEEGHGDCGQVSLLYISLMRTLGVPARWESGWMLHPGELNLHDWAEVYFEGVGWVPVDVSFGRYTGSENPEIQKFYSHGMDSHRFAANKGVGCDFYPPKKFVRSETVDFQVGEVECSKGNLFYPAWSYDFDLISSTPID